MIYLGLITAFSYTAALYLRGNNSAPMGFLGAKSYHPLAFVIPAILFTVFSGLRSGIGDTYFIMRSFAMLPDKPPFPVLFSREFIYRLLVYLLRSFTDRPQLLIYIGAIFSCLPPIYFLYKNAYRYELAIFLFVTSGYYTFSFNGMRQYMAAGILLMGGDLLFTKERHSFLKYVLVVLLASGFHRSALIMLPIYFLVRRKAGANSILILLFLGALSPVALKVFLPQFLKFLSLVGFGIYEESGWFTKGEEGGASVLRVLFAALPPTLAWFSKEKLKESGEKAEYLVNLSFVNLFFYLLSLGNWIFARLAIYTEIYNLMLVPLLVEKAFKEKDRRKAYFASIVVYTVFFIGISYSVREYRSNFFRTVFF